MKGASEDNGWAICPEVIIVSDDENEIANSEGTGRRSFTEVVDKLLLLAKNPTLRNDNEVVSALIRELGITPTMKITCSLQATCEKLGYLLDFVNGHERRHRACEDLVMVLCEVLRLVQTAPYKLGNNNEICKTRDTLYDNSNPMDLAYGLMDRWGAWLLQCPRSSDDRSFAMGLVISRLETISMKFSDDINNFQNSVVMCEQQLKNTAEEWFETLKKCRHDLQFESLKPFEREWKVFDKTFCTTQAVQIKFEESKKARKTLIYHVQEKKLRCEFYRACLTLVYAVTQLAGIHAHEQHCAKDVNMVMNDMMIPLLEGLQTKRIN
ncbi:hypothetical protein PsorP6_008218 [Peronosclerospora sorghi]|uniref:Uncharacterized protein n=1 Tax=Peronosclerospora sorghi TaxID=230839 RepID=A0ACC0W7F8_9STRA|nr:hypothetical protein PsorP6_008218 [Peronosclerospora sorghi]